MSFWTAIALIVLIATLGRIYSARQKTLRRNPVAPDSGEAARLRAEVARLNDRIKVLERLATDPAKRLSDEIDALKDK
jgi:hypothetical protein